jgi:hypothetical protein
MKVSIEKALSLLGTQFQGVDFNGIQRIIDTFDDPKIATIAYADPNNFMISKMKKNGIAVPEGLHFHRREGDRLVPPEPSECVSPQVSLVLAASPRKDFELEHFQIGGGGDAPPESLAPTRSPCHSCFICIVF